MTGRQKQHGQESTAHLKQQSTSTWGGSETGTSLVEALVSTGVTAFGVLAVAALFLYGIRLQAVSRDGSTATELAVSRLEQLRMLPNVAPQRQNGGNLTSVVDTAHSATVGSFQVLWLVTDGPATTKDVTVVVKSINTMARPAQIEGLLWR